MMKYVLLIVVFVITMGCGGRNNNKIIPDTTKMTNIMDWSLNKDFERLDSLYMEMIQKNIDIDRGAWHYEPDSMTYIKAYASENDYDIYIYKKDSYMALQKAYYANGFIKYKGWRFCADNFQEGEWYYFDEEGNLEKTVDYNKGFDFTWEDVLKFCQKNNIEVPMGYETGITVVKIRDILNRHWQITDYNVWGKKTVYDLDARTGKLLKKEEFSRIL